MSIAMEEEIKRWTTRRKILFEASLAHFPAHFETKLETLDASVAKFLVRGRRDGAGQSTIQRCQGIFQRRQIQRGHRIPTHP